MHILLSSFLGLARTMHSSLLAQQSDVASGWIWVLIFIVVVVVVWWLLTRSASQEPPDIEPHHSEGEDLVVEHLAADELDAGVIETTLAEPDDLSRLEGIGPKINALLQEAGITTFTQLAETDTSHLNEILDVAGLTFADTSTWPEQARLAAEGNWEALEGMQDELKGGRRIE